MKNPEKESWIGFEAQAQKTFRAQSVPSNSWRAAMRLLAASQVSQPALG